MTRESDEFNVGGGQNQFLPRATHAVQNIYGSQQRESRLARRFRLLMEEIESDSRLRESIHDIQHYNTVLDGSRGLDAKLADGGFAPAEIDDARRAKQQFAMKMCRYQHYESAQHINVYLFGQVKVLFDTYVVPLVKGDAPISEVRRSVYERVLMPVMEKIERDGADDLYLCYTEADILGLVYYLTGNCHLNWADYERHIPQP